jgi:hypothetical protein
MDLGQGQINLENNLDQCHVNEELQTNRNCNHERSINNNNNNYLHIHYLALHLKFNLNDETIEQKGLDVQCALLTKNLFNYSGFQKAVGSILAKSLFDFMCQVLLLEEKSFHVQKSLTLSKSS